MGLDGLDMTGKGFFISLEGCDGCGKSTQSGLLARYLTRKGYKCILTREPGGTSIGEKMRKMLLHSEGKDLSRMTEVLLFNAARVEHVRQVIAPALARGKIVISDRFFDATLAYQGYGSGISPGLIKKLHKLCLNGLQPDLTIFLDRAVDDSLGNVKTKDRIERRALAYHTRVLAGYRKIGRADPRRVKRVIVLNNKKDTARVIARICDKILGKKS